MSFNEGAGLDVSQVVSGKGGAMVGGGIGGLILMLVIVFLGGNPLSGSGVGDPSEIFLGGSQGETVDLSECRTGADANRSDVCRIVGTVNSVQDYWREALPADINVQYRDAKTVIFSGSTSSACGTASAATGPFYCPPEERVYIDAGFFDQLSGTYGSDGGTLAQMYVVAHEYGHHVQQILGILAKAQDGRTGPQSGGVRVELMADCFAGVWAHHAATTRDANGNTLIKPLTQTDIRSALSAAAAVGDDHIQGEVARGQVKPETWTHGSSESRQRWFLNGYQSGNLNTCDTFATNNL